MDRFLTKDFLSGLMFVGFGFLALYFGQSLAVGTSVRMGPGYVPRMLSFILFGLGGVICLIALVNGSEAVKTPFLEADHHGDDRHRLLRPAL